jgi:predicted Ser/Thr protein kinase
MSDLYRHLGGNMSDTDFALRRLRRAVEAAKNSKDGSHLSEVVERFEELDRLIIETGELPEDWQP